MTSLHRLIALVLVWAAVAYLGASLVGLAMMAWGNPTFVTIIYCVLFASAGAGTWAIARAGLPRA